MRFKVVFLFLLAFSNLLVPDKLKAESFGISVYLPYNYNVQSQDDNLEYDFDSAPTGLNIQFKSPLYLGLGLTILTKPFQDISTDYKYTINNAFFDISYKLPVPEIFNLTVGIGIGQSELKCENSSCEDYYEANNGEFLKQNSSQAFVNLGVKVGYIYKINFGFHRLNTGTLRIINEDTRKDLLSLDANANVFTAGVSIDFM